MSPKKRFPWDRWKNLGTENYANEIWAEIKWIWKITWKAEHKALNLSCLDIVEKEQTLKNETRELACYYLSDNIWEIAMGIGLH